MGAFGAGGNILNTAFDSQQDLYNRTLQQVQDQTRAANEAAGVGTTPYGAGIESQAARNFNIDWQNQQLQRMIQGGQAGAGLQAGASPLFMQSAGLPYGAAQTIGGNQMGALGQLGQFGTSAAGIPGQQIGALQNYLGWGTGQQNLAGSLPLQQYYAGLGGQQQAFNQAQLAGFQDPYQAAQFGWDQQQNLFMDQLAREKQAANESQQMWSGLGKLGGWAFPGGLSSVGSSLGNLGSLATGAMTLF
jgi:hypothetical protein